MPDFSSGLAHVNICLHFLSVYTLSKLLVKPVNNSSVLCDSNLIQTGLEIAQLGLAPIIAVLLLTISRKT